MVIGGIDVGGLVGGIEIEGAPCNRVHLRYNFPLVMQCFF